MAAQSAYDTFWVLPPKYCGHKRQHSKKGLSMVRLAEVPLRVFSFDVRVRAQSYRRQQFKLAPKRHCKTIETRRPSAKPTHNKSRGEKRVRTLGQKQSLRGLQGSDVVIGRRSANPERGGVFSLSRLGGRWVRAKWG